MGLFRHASPQHRPPRAPPTTSCRRSGRREAVGRRLRAARDRGRCRSSSSPCSRTALIWVDPAAHRSSRSRSCSPSSSPQRSRRRWLDAAARRPVSARDRHLAPGGRSSSSAAFALAHRVGRAAISGATSYAQAQEGFTRSHRLGRRRCRSHRLAEQLDEWTGHASPTSSRAPSSAPAPSRGVDAVTNFVTGLVLLVTILFFFLKDGPQMWEFLLRPFRGESYASGAAHRRQDDRHARLVCARNGARRARRRRRHPDRPADPAGAPRDSARGADVHPVASSRSSERPWAGSSPRSSHSSRTARSTPFSSSASSCS